MPRGLSFRVAHMHPSQVGQVGSIERDSFATPWQDKYFHAHILHPNSTPLTAITLPSLQVVGYLILWWENSKKIVQVQNLAVHRNFRCQGVGRFLMLAGLGLAASGGFKTASLEVRPSNEHALKLYYSLGFKEVGTRPGYYQLENEDALVLECDISEGRFADAPHPENN